MEELRDIYASKAVTQIPRILSLEDRNPFSQTYGCFDRRFWLDKVMDFPTALAQFAVHSLALVYTHRFPQSIYYRQPKIRDWCIAGMDYWTRIQHRDGAFDEFYPFERGWAGPTAFTLYAIVDSYQMLGADVPSEVETRLLEAIYRAAMSIIRFDESGGILANHHAIAILAIWKAYQILDRDELYVGFEKKWENFLKYYTDEGWSLEYDGPDPGYLSATVSFLGKLYKERKTEDLCEVLKGSIDFASYFVYPNKFYAGIVGSRQTLHFYPHGFEILSREIPLAGAVAQKMLEGLREDKLVPPEIMADRYFLYRVSELLQSYLDWQPRSDVLPLLPYERPPFVKYFPQGKMFVAKTPRAYLVANLAKGGVTKVFSLDSNRLIYNDSGMVGTLQDGKVVSSQWIDRSHEIIVDEAHFAVAGRLNRIPSQIFTPFKMILFRLTLLAIGWSARLSHLMKGSIRKVMMLGSRPVPVAFRRSLRLRQDSIDIQDQIALLGKSRFSSLFLGDEFPVRYVPQSRYFQSQELDSRGLRFDEELLSELNTGREITVSRRIDVAEGTVHVEVSPGNREYDW
ncbi:MAG: hypothetical protein ACETWR_25055 [Anaerolineae bacterium]